MSEVNYVQAGPVRDTSYTITATDGTNFWKYTVGGGYCNQCGKLYTYVGDWIGGLDPPWCTCRKDGNNVAWIAPNFDAPIEPAPARPAWQCPGCKRWNAPHVDRCGCQE